MIYYVMIRVLNLMKIASGASVGQQCFWVNF